MALLTELIPYLTKKGTRSEMMLEKRSPLTNQVTSKRVNRKPDPATLSQNTTAWPR